MAARWSAWLVWAALAGSLVFWGLRLFAHPAGVPAQARTVGAEQAVRGDVLRMLGGADPVAAPAAAAAPPAASRFRLIGAIVPGWAMLAVDGQPPRLVRAGGRVDGDWVLQSVGARQVAIGPVGGAAVVTLDLPQLPPPATGTLPAATSGAAPGAGLPAQAMPAPGLPPAPPPPAPPVMLPPSGAPVPGQDGVVSSSPPSMQAPPDGAGTVTGGAMQDPNAMR